jgi:SNF2 family DNA or RNA helicase
MIKTDLMPHQKRIVKFGKSLDGFGMFSGFGSGKSLAALSIIQENHWKRVLIISTKTAIQSTWPEQIKQHSNFYYSLLVGDSRQKLKKLYSTIDRLHSMQDSRGNRPVMIFLVNFDGVRNIFNALMAIKPDVVIVDELLRAKNGSALRSKVLWKLGEIIPKRIGLTGFPVSENLKEVYSQTRFLDRGATFGKSEAKFLHEFFTKKNGKWIPKEGAETEIFSKLKEFCIMVPESVIKLPPKVVNKIGLEPSEQQKKYLDALSGDFKSELGRLKINVDSIYALWIKSLQVCNGFFRDGKGNVFIIDSPKDEALFEQLEKIGKQEKVLIWTTDIFTLKKLSHLSRRFGYNALTLYGKTVNPGGVVKIFQNSHKYNLLIATIQKANESITLSNCRYGMYYSRNWSNDQKSNADARIRRKGSEKHKSIIYTDFFIKGSVEEAVIQCVDGKQNVVKELKKYFSA